MRLPALSALALPVQGGPSTLSPSPGRGVHGASWRMVVELGPEVRAWATYPGGQSGNPASPYYLDRLPAWLAGTLDTVLFPRTPADLPVARIRSGESQTDPTLSRRPPGASRRPVPATRRGARSTGRPGARTGTA